MLALLRRKTLANSITATHPSLTIITQSFSRLTTGINSSAMPAAVRKRMTATTVPATSDAVVVENGRGKRRAVHTEAKVNVAPIEVVQPSPSPVKRPRRSSTRKEELGSAAVNVKQEEQETKMPVKARRKAAEKVETYNEDVDDVKQEEKKATKGRGKKTRKVNGNKKDSDAAEEAADEFMPSDKEDLDEEKGTGKKAKGGKRTRKPKEPMVYVIPDVPLRDFRLEGPLEKRAERSQGYRGRLGYACLNTILRNQDPPKFNSRNVRLKTIEEKGLGYVKELALQNVRDIIPLLEFNAANNIHMMRLSSEIFPFASHDVHGYDISFAEKELREAGEAAKRLNQRLTMHPGQFCQLGTPKKSVLEASLRELDVHAKVLDLMGVGPEGVMILHGGGTFGDRQATLDRIRDTINNRLSPSVRARLVLENDELGYSAEELLPLCESLDPPVPLVFDFHHDMLRPSSLSPAQIIVRAQALFAKRGVPPKYHLSEPRPGAMTHRDRRAHSDRCMQLPPDLPADADLMLECKDKEQGVLEMFRIYQLHNVQHDVLRPPADDLSVAKGGRRSKLDGSGGSTHKRTKSTTSSSSHDESDKEADESNLTAKGTPRKERVTEASLVERAIAKAKAVAAKRGVAYTGPRSRQEIEASRAAFATGETVKRDMEQQAEWLRNELRAGRERRPYPGSADAAQEQNAPQSQAEPEPEAY